MAEAGSVDTRAEEAEAAYRQFLAEAEEKSREILPGDELAPMREALGGALYVLYATMEFVPISKAPNGLVWDISGRAVSISRHGTRGFPAMFLDASRRAERAIELAHELVEAGRLDDDGCELLQQALSAGGDRG